MATFAEQAAQAGAGIAGFLNPVIGGTSTTTTTTEGGSNNSTTIAIVVIVIVVAIGLILAFGKNKKINPE